MKIEKTNLEGLLLVQPALFKDDRGWFLESYHRNRYREAGIDVDFVQDNHSRSAKGTLRGLHYQKHPGQAKLVRCVLGLIWDVAVDIRPQSPTFGRHFGCHLEASEHKQFFIPVGFAHGFVVLSEWAEVEYKCSWFYEPKTEAGIQWDDKDLGVPWPLDGITPILSKRDLGNPGFRESFS